MEIEIKLLDETYREDKMYIITMASPPRLGGMLFSAILENWKYPPATPENAKYELGLVKFGEVLTKDKNGNISDKYEEARWFIISIPLNDKPYAMEAAKKSFIVLRNTIPIIIHKLIFASLSIPKLKYMDKTNTQIFPFVKPNVYTVENEIIPNLTPEKYKALLKVESQLAQKIMGTFKTSPETEANLKKFDEMLKKI